jgi:hypothetical protein
MVTGISGTSKINLGTWRALRPARMLALSSARSEGVREGVLLLRAGTTKRKTASSASCGRRRPTQSVLEKMLLKGGDSTMA